MEYAESRRAICCGRRLGQWQPNGITSPAVGETIRGVIVIEGVAQHPDFRKAQLDLLIDGDENQVAQVGLRGFPAYGSLMQMDSQLYPHWEPFAAFASRRGRRQL